MPVSGLHGSGPSELVGRFQETPPGVEKGSETGHSHDRCERTPGRCEGLGHWWCGTGAGKRS
eukprot:11147685-Alexandrium_andersonii.AAC.1